MDTPTLRQRENSIPTTNKVCGGGGGGYKETKRYGRTDGRTHGQRKNCIPTTNKVCGFAGGIINFSNQGIGVRIGGLVFTIH